MSRLLRALLVVSSLPLLPICTQAHMQLSWPYPLRSPLDPDVPISEKDYDMTLPLSSTGSNFPCKHYQDISTNPGANNVKAVYQAGGTYNITLTGTATHEGGSCQISISYDNGFTFKVIESIIGGCPLTLRYDFTIPSFAPSSDSVLLSWSWFNLIGNREMYQNCARVQIQNAPIQRYRRTAFKRQTSVNDLPDMFACNVNNGCATIERREVIFPNPGNNVIYGQDGVTPDPGPGFTVLSTPSGNAFSTISPTNVTIAPTSTAFAGTTLTPAPFPLSNATMTAGPSGTGFGTGITTNLTSFTLTMANSTVSFTTVTITTTIISSASPTSSGDVVVRVPSSTSLSVITITTIIPITTSTTPLTTTLPTVATFTTSTTSNPFPSATLVSTPCTLGAFTCNSTTTWSQCIQSGPGTTALLYRGSTAAGMVCVDGQFVRENDGPCTPNGSLFCKGSNAFYLCDQGGLINMGPVALGTSCVNGVIQ